MTVVDRSPLRTASNLVWLPVILLGTFLGTPRIDHLPLAIVAAVLGSLGWLVAVWAPTTPVWLLPAGIVAVDLGGLLSLAGVGGWSTPVSFCFYAMVVAGSRLPVPAAVSLFVATAVGLLFVAPREDLTTQGVVSLGLGAVLLLGMSRRDARQRAEQREIALAATARAQEEHARAAALAERGRIARDIHDVLAHSLSALAVQLQGARLMALRDNVPADNLAQIERAQRLAQDGLAEARRAVAALRTPPVDLADGLRALVADTPDASLEIDGEPGTLDATARETVLRTAQEALSNVRKHAAGAPVRVTLTHRDGATALEVRDRAGAPPARADGGYGLIGMAERAALAGATLDTGPTEDGWRVRLVLPDSRT